jgi:hypothetical protein
MELALCTCCLDVPVATCNSHCSEIADGRQRVRAEEFSFKASYLVFSKQEVG